MTHSKLVFSAVLGLLVLAALAAPVFARGSRPLKPHTSQHASRPVHAAPQSLPAVSKPNIKATAPQSQPALGQPQRNLQLMANPPGGNTPLNPMPTSQLRNSSSAPQSRAAPIDTGVVATALPSQPAPGQTRRDAQLVTNPPGGRVTNPPGGNTGLNPGQTSQPGQTTTNPYLNWIHDLIYNTLSPGLLD